MPRKEAGIRRKGKGWQVYVRVNGELRTQTFAIDHPRTKMREWRDTQKKDQHRRRVSGSLLADVERFLAKPEIAAQPYVHHTARHLALWVDALGGDRSRAVIERDELESVIQGWLTVFQPSTVYHRRSALLSLYNTLDGVGAANPVKETTCPKAWTPANHAVPFSKLSAIVDAMPAWRYPKKGIQQPSAAKIIGRVIVEVGIRPADLLRVQRSDLFWDDAAFRWPASTKGRGVAARIVPLTPNGLAAFRAFDAANLYGQFSPEAVSHSFKRGARKIDGPETPIHLYTGRHTLGADLYRATRDLATVGRMLNHAPGSRATPQYAQDANADVDRAAAASLSTARQVQPPAQKLPQKSPAPRKPLNLRRLQR